MPPIPNSAKAARTYMISQLQICFVESAAFAGRLFRLPLTGRLILFPAIFNMVSLAFQNSLRTDHRDPGSLFLHLLSADGSSDHKNQRSPLPYDAAQFPDTSCFPDNILPGCSYPASVISVSYPVHFSFHPVKFFLAHKLSPFSFTLSSKTF